MTHNTDISNSWERETDDPRFFQQFSPDGYALGINVVIYAMTTERPRLSGFGYQVSWVVQASG